MRPYGIGPIHEEAFIVVEHVGHHQTYASPQKNPRPVTRLTLQRLGSSSHAKPHLGEKMGRNYYNPDRA